MMPSEIICTEPRAARRTGEARPAARRRLPRDHVDAHHPDGPSAEREQALIIPRRVTIRSGTLLKLTSPSIASLISFANVYCGSPAAAA